MKSSGPLLVVLALAGSVAAQTLTRGPSVWMHTDTSFLVAFQSSSATVGEVRWGPTPALGRLARGPSTADHAIEIQGLDPDRFYWYRVLLGGQPVTPVHRTRTFPAAGSSDLSFFVVADTGAGTPEQMQVADLLTRWTFDLGILPGDIIYEAGERQNFDPRFFVPYAPLLRGLPFFPVTGNHDVITESGVPFFEAFYLPTKNSGSERWFSFDAGDIHFVGLESYAYSVEPQTGWLRSDLAAARARGVRWIFVFFHHTCYSSSARGPDLGLRWTWCPILEEFEVDAVFTGHDHHYERTHVVRDFFQNKRGVVYFVVGTGGRALQPLGSVQPYTAARESKHGALKVEVRGDVLRTSFLDGTSGATFGSEIDTWTMRRGLVTPALRAASAHPTPGQVFTGEVDARAGWAYVLFFSPSAGWLPLPGIGIQHLARGQEVLLATGIMGRGKSSRFSLTVPNDARLVGIDLLFQAAAVDLARPSARLTDVLVSRVR